MKFCEYGTSTSLSHYPLPNKANGLEENVTIVFQFQDQVLNIWKKCDTCTLLFPDLPTLTMHKQSTHKKKGKSFNNAKVSKKICKFCNYQVAGHFCRLKNAKSHLEIGRVNET